MEQSVIKVWLIVWYRPKDLEWPSEAVGGEVARINAGNLFLYRNSVDSERD